MARCATIGRANAASPSLEAGAPAAPRAKCVGCASWRRGRPAPAGRRPRRLDEASRKGQTRHARPGRPVAVKFSFASLARQALSGHQGWSEQWRSPDPKPSYEVVIVGAGGHGLATAYYLAKAAWPRQRRRRRQGLARRRQYRAQHDHRALQLSLRGLGGDLRARAQACGRRFRRSSTTT